MKDGSASRFRGALAYFASEAYTSESCACWMNSNTGSGWGVTGQELGV